MNMMMGYPPPDETLTQSGVAADAKVVGDELAKKADLEHSMYCIMGTPTNIPYMATLPNIGAEDKIITLDLHDAETFVFIVGAAAQERGYVSLVGGEPFPTINLREAIYSNASGKVVNVTLPKWFRGMIFSYYPFSITGV